MIFLYLLVLVAVVTPVVLFLTMRKVHHTLPRHIKLPFARRLQARIGQRNTA